MFLNIMCNPGSQKYHSLQINPVVLCKDMDYLAKLTSHIMLIIFSLSLIVEALFSYLKAGIVDLPCREYSEN